MLEQLKFLDLPDPPIRPISFKPLDSPVWTKNKARLIERYLYYFVLVTKHGTYIDGFAGPQESDKPDTWTAKLVLESEPRRLRHIILCDTSASSTEKLMQLKESQPYQCNGGARRIIEVRHGDFNEVIREILISNTLKKNEATFCLLDQRTFECHWSTLQELASYKQSDWKIELFYFLPSSWLDRALAAQQKTSVLESWWGGPDWRQLHNLKGDARAEIFRKRFIDELGYKHVHYWPIYERESGEGRVMYYMIHATDHHEAPKLMHRAYKEAVTRMEPLNQLPLYP